MDVLPNYRASQEWWDVARKLLIKPPAEYTEFDKEYLELSFEVWKKEVKEKVLVFVDPEGELVYLPYETRFTSERYAKKLIAKFNEAWAKATEMFDVGVFLTITLPPIFPPIIQKYALSYLRHRIKAYLRKKYGDKILFASNYEEGGAKDLRTPPHVSVYEPQKNLNPHLHDIYFGITRIMDKRDITRWLDDLLVRFLSRMGHHIQKTVNNRLTEEQVKWFNKYGKKLLKKYLRYKKKHPKYKGPINWITQVKRKSFKTDDGKVVYYWEFAHPPPDYVKFIEERQKQTKLSTDGGSYSPVDYLRKYLLKNLREIIEDEESKVDIKVVIEKEKERKGKRRRLAWYWLARARFYSFSPIFRNGDRKKGKKGDSEWRFVGSFTEDYLEYLKWLKWKRMNELILTL